MKKTRVLILDDHTILRQGLARLLNAEPDMEMKVGCGSVGEALLIVAAGLVDVVVLDWIWAPSEASIFYRKPVVTGFRDPSLFLPRAYRRRTGGCSKASVFLRYCSRTPR